MGLFDFLKIERKAPKKAPKAARPPNNRVEFDGKSFPIGAITGGGLVAMNFDGSLITGQNARISVLIDDAIGKFSFTTSVIVTDTSGGKMTAQWTMLPPETETLVKKYAQLKKAKGAK